MKNRVKIAAGIALIIYIFGTSSVYASETQEEKQESEPKANTEIIFDADAVKNKIVAKSALADMHGVFVFREAFIQQEKLVKEAEKEKREEIENLVLTAVQPELDCQEWVDIVLHADTDRYIKDYYIEDEESQIFVWIYCISASICLLCVAIRVEDYLKKKKKQQN